MQILSRLPDAELAAVVGLAHQAAVQAELHAHACALLYCDLAARMVQRATIRAGLAPGDTCELDGVPVRFCGLTVSAHEGPRVLLAYQNNRLQWGPPRECKPDILGKLKRTSVS